MTDDEKKSYKPVKAFEDIEAFQKAYKISLAVHKVSLKFPSIEQYALGDQLRKASKSICANIAEGYGKQKRSPAEFKRFLLIALGSSDEMRVWSRYRFDLGYINEKLWQEWRDEYSRISRMLQGLINKFMISSSVIRHPSSSYIMPAEWEKHVATWLAWPHNEKDWPGKFGPIPWVYTEIIAYVTQVERVRLIVQNAAEKKQAREMCKRAGAKIDNIDFYIIPTDRIWMRDSGPTFVRDAKGKKTLLDWRFNAWAKYPNHLKDDKIPAAINAHFKLPIVQPMHNGKRVVLEGGAIDVNGKGTLLTTEECLLSKIQCRNPGFTREDYEIVFENYLGIRQIIWLGDGVVNDDTHGHIDDLARFVNADTIVTVVEKNKRDENYKALADNLKRLKKARDQNGKQLNVVELPMPRPFTFEGLRLPASYANFLVANGLVLMPTFNDANDRVALSILAELFPKHEVVGIHASDLIWGFGTLHCMSQQEFA